MQNNCIDILQKIENECVNLRKEDKPDNLALLLNHDFSDEELNTNEVKEIINRIVLKVENNAYFSDKDVLNCLAGLPLSFFIGLEKWKKNLSDLDYNLNNILEELRSFDPERPTYLESLFACVDDDEITNDFIELCKIEVDKQECFKDRDLIKFLSGFKLTKLLGIEK